MPKLRKCCVVGCNANNETHRLFNFPKDDKLRKLWLSFLVPVNVNLSGLSKKQLLNRHVCQKHFDRHQFDGMGNRLAHGYPCLFADKEMSHGIPLSSSAEGQMIDHNYAIKYGVEGSIEASTSSKIYGLSKFPPKETVEDQGASEQDHNLQDPLAVSEPSSSTEHQADDEDQQLDLIPGRERSRRGSETSSLWTEKSCTPEPAAIDSEDPLRLCSPEPATVDFEHSTFNNRIDNMLIPKAEPLNYEVERTSSVTLPLTQIQNIPKKISPSNQQLIPEKIQCKLSPSYRERKLLEKQACLKVKIMQLRKRVRQIDRINSPVLRMLIESSILNHNKKARGCRWSQLHKSVAMGIFIRSPIAYRYLKQHMPMPCVRSVRRMLELKRRESSDIMYDFEKYRTDITDDITVDAIDDDAFDHDPSTTPTTLEEQLDRARQHIQHLTTVIDKLKNQNDILKDRLTSAKYNKDNVFDKFTESMTPAARVFTRMQYLQTVKKPGPRRYSPEEKLVAVTMYNSSPAGYATLAKIFTLPTEQLIEKFSRELQAMSESMETNEQELNNQSEHLMETDPIPEQVLESNEQELKNLSDDLREADPIGTDQHKLNNRPEQVLKSFTYGGRGRWRLSAPPRSYGRRRPPPNPKDNPIQCPAPENVAFVPEANSTVEIDSQIHDVGDNSYKRRLDMALVGLTYDMPELG